MKGSKITPSEDREHEFVLVPTEEILELIVHQLQAKAGVDSWEIFLEEVEELAIEVRGGEVESLISARPRGIAVRVLCHRKMGFSFTNNFSPAALRKMVDQAVEAAVQMPTEAPSAFPPPPEDGWPQLRIYDARLREIARQEKINVARRAEEAARAYDRRITCVRGAEYREAATRTWVWNSSGVRAETALTLITVGVEAVAEYKGEAQSASEFETVHYYDMLKETQIGTEAALKAVGLLGARAMPGGRYGVVLAPRAAAELMLVAAAAAGGDAVLKQRSWLAGSQGRKIGSKVVSLYDDPLWEAGPAAAPFDDEGVRSQRTVVIEAGVVENFLYDMYYGAKAGTGSTSNGIRPNYHFPPQVDTTNWVLMPGEAEEEELIGTVKDGIYIVDVLGVHTADAVTGEFSLGAQGFRIKGGQKGPPVAGIMISGTLREVLPSIAAVGNRVRFIGEVGAPAVLIEALEVSGQAGE